ncbi:hypothetical protein BBJ29_009841, partial [Phytophthora kernoviae]
LRRDGDLSDMRLEGRRLALGRNVVSHHSVDYDRLADVLASEKLPMPPPPSRVAMFASFHVASSYAFNDAADHELLNDYGDHVVSRRLSTATGDEDKTVPFNSWSNSIDTLQYSLAFLVVLVAAHPLGLFFPKYFKLPLITGYLVTGIIAGPFVANLLSEGLVDMLANYLKSIFILLGTLYVTAMVVLTSVHLLAEKSFFYDDFAISCQLGISLMFGSISVLGSPATVMAIKIELNSVGPFTNLMLGATMMAEFVVLVSFSISRIVCSIYCAKLDVSMGNLVPATDVDHTIVSHFSLLLKKEEMARKVWFQLVDAATRGAHADTQTASVSSDGVSDIDDLREAIREKYRHKNPDILEGVVADQLDVYANRTVYDDKDGQPLDPSYMAVILKYSAHTKAIAWF